MSDFTKDLAFETIRDGLELASYVDGPVEIKVVKIMKGAKIPLYSH